MTATSNTSRHDTITRIGVIAALVIGGGLIGINAYEGYQDRQAASYVMSKVGAASPSPFDNISFFSTSDDTEPLPEATKEKGECFIDYTGHMELFVQGDGEGYGWTAVLPYEEFTFSGNYTNPDTGETRNCDLATYEAHFREFQVFDSAAGITTDDGSTLNVWGQGYWETHSIHRVQGFSNEHAGLSEGDIVSDPVLLYGSQSLECGGTACGGGIAWIFNITATYDGDVVLPSEERMES